MAMPSELEQLKAENEQLKAENKELQGGYIAFKRDMHKFWGDVKDWRNWMSNGRWRTWLQVTPFLAVIVWAIIWDGKPFFKDNEERFQQMIELPYIGLFWAIVGGGMVLLFTYQLIRLTAWWLRVRKEAP